MSEKKQDYYFFVKRPIFAFSISMLIIVGGFAALLGLPVQRYPQIAPPTIAVFAVYPGSDARTVSELVAGPIEREINGVENMLHISTVCSSNGTMITTVSFEPGTDLDIANVLVQNRVALAEPRLPEEVRRLGISVIKRSSETAMFAGIYSPNGTYDEVFLTNYVNMNIKDELARSPGVGDVSVYGAGEFSMRIWLDPIKMQARGISSQEVIAAVREQNVQSPGGVLGAPPMPSPQAYQYIVNLNGQMSTAQEFRDIIIREKEGRLLRLGDIARVELAAESYGFRGRLNGKNAVIISVNQIPGSNVITVVNGLRERMEAISTTLPEDVEYTIVHETSEVILVSMANVIITLFLTMAIVIFTVYLFLQNLRATLIPALTIPVSLIGAFIALKLLGFSLNTLTLFGLVLVIGIVVDDAIVVVENTARLLATGLDPVEAASQSIRQVFGPVIATTLVLLAVFVPSAFLGGITGELFRQFAITISVATVFSTINALTLSPALCAVLLKTPSEEKKRFSLLAPVEWTIGKMNRAYGVVVRRAVQFAVITIILFFAASALGVLGFIRLPTGFVPQEDEGYCMVNIQLPKAASLDRTTEFSNAIEQIVMNTPGVANIAAVDGFSLLDGVVSPNSSFIIAVFDDWGDRKTPEVSQEAIIASLNRQIASLPEGIAFAFAMPSLPGLGITSGFSFVLQDRGGIGIAALAQIVDQVNAEAIGQTAIASASTTFQSDIPQYRVNVDRDRVKTRGLSLQAVYSTISSNLAEAYINDFPLFGRTFKVKMQADAPYRISPEDITNLPISGPSGESVPIGAVASVEEIIGPISITRHNLFEALKIRGTAAPGFSSGDAMAVVEGMLDRTLPDSVGYEWTDISFQEKRASQGAVFLYLFSIVIVYLVLAAQYESLSIPIVVIFAVPPAIIGAAVALMARGYDMNVYTQIAVVLLIGLSTKTAILIAEFAKELRDGGKSPQEAAVEAAELRFRAVLMTTLSFVFGVIPLLVASGAGAQSQRAIGTAVFGGMLVVSFLSVLAIPAFFALIVRKRKEE